MNPPVIWTYLGIVVALLILLWAVLQMGSRLIRSRRKGVKAETLSTWVRLDSTSAEQEEPLSLPEEDVEEQEEKAEQEPQTRAQQNGHYSESKKLL